jgi:hypothetical protein
MPTTNPRINVTLSPSLDLVVGRMAVATRVSKSQVLRELLEAAEPALQRAVALMEAAKEASRDVRVNLADQLARGVEHAEDSMAVILSRLDRAQRDLVGQAEAVQGKRPARRPGAERPDVVTAGSKAGNPPASNRGVKSAPKRGQQAKTPRKSRAS